MKKDFGHVLITHPSGRQEAIPFHGAHMRIGSAADNDLVLVGSAIMPHHASLRCNDHGDLLITIAGAEVEVPRASAGSAIVRIGGYVLHVAAGDAADHSGGYVMRQANQPAHYARTDEAALLSALLRLDAHEAATIEMPTLNVDKTNDHAT